MVLTQSVRIFIEQLNFQFYFLKICDTHFLRTERVTYYYKSSTSGIRLARFDEQQFVMAFAKFPLLTMELGCDVLTAYGWGILSAVDHEANHYSIDLDDWELAGASVATLYCTSSAIIGTSFFDVGACILTKYGSGIVLQYRRTDSMYVVRMWRPHGEGSATAYLPASDIIRRLPAATGCRVHTPYGNGYVNSIRYTGAQDPIIYSVQLPYGTAYMSADTVECKESSVIPAADYLFSQMTGPSKLKMYIDEAGKQVPIIGSLRGAWEKISEGDFTVNDILKDRAKQLNEYVQKIDAKALEAKLQDSVKSHVGEAGQIESLLSEGRKRVVQLIENAEKRSELTDQTKKSLSDYLKVGVQQVDEAVESIKQEMKPNEQQIIDGVLDIKHDFESSLTVMKDVAKSDPVLQDILRRIEETAAEARARSELISNQLKETKSIQTLADGTQKVTKKMEDLLLSPEAQRMKELGSRVMKSIGKQGEEKGRELIDGVKSRVLRHLSQDDKNDSIVKTIENKIMEELGKWQNGSYKQVSSTVTDGITSLSFLLGVVSEGRASVQKPADLVAMALSKSSVSRDFASSPKSFMFRKLVDMLLVMKSRISGRSISGHAFLRQFQMSASASARRALSSFARPEVNKVTKMINAAIDPEYADAAAPITALVGQMASGQFNLDSALKAALSSLNSKGMTLAAERILASGDKMVGALEAFSQSDAVQLAMIKLQSMDIESTLSSKLGGFDTKLALDQAEDALTNAEARARMINNTKDQILGFLLENLPSMSVPDIQGVKDDVQFSITGLDMSGFRLRKEDVTVELGTSMKDEFLTCTATGIAAKFARIKWKFLQLYFPYLNGGGSADAAVNSASIKLGLKLIRVPKGVVKALGGAAAARSSLGDGVDVPPPTAQDEEAFYRQYPGVKAAVEAIRTSSADSSAQVLERGGSSGSSSSGGGGLVANPPANWGDVSEWEPALVLSSKLIFMQSLELNIENSQLAWLYNLLASVFAGLIKDYVCASLKDVVGTHSAMLLGGINSMTSSYWPAIKQILSVTLESLPVASHADIAALMGPPIGDRPLEIIPREYTLKFSEEGSLGFKMHIFKPDAARRHSNAGEGTAAAAAAAAAPEAAPTAPVKSSGCRALITGVVPGTQAERILKEKNMLGMYVDSTIVAVNTKQLSSKFYPRACSVMRECGL